MPRYNLRPLEFTFYLYKKQNRAQNCDKDGEETNQLADEQKL